jgi:hypothetical protein
MSTLSKKTLSRKGSESVTKEPTLQYSFEECFDKKEVRKLLKVFCNTMNCEELVLFIEGLAELTKLRGGNNKALKTYQIYNMFIVTNKELSLNIRNETREDIIGKMKVHLEQFGDASPEEASNGTNYEMKVDSDIFQDAEDEVMEQLRNNIFPLFLKTSEFESYVKKNSESVDTLCVPVTSPTASSNNLSSAAPDDLSSFSDPRSDDSFRNQPAINTNITLGQFVKTVLDNKTQVFEKDVTAFLSFAYSDAIAWKVLAEEPKFTVSISEEFEGNRTVKLTGTVPYNVETVLKACVSKDFRLDGKFKEKISEVEYIKAFTPYAKDGSKELSTVVTREIAKLPFPLSSREFVIAGSALYYKPTDQFQERYVHFYKSTMHNMVPKKKSPIRGVTIGGYICEKLNDNESKYVYILYLDMKGWISKKILTGMFKNQGYSVHTNLMSHLAKVSKQGNVGSYRAMDTLNDYMHNHHPKSK